MSAHNSSDLLLVLNILFSVFNSLHSVTMIKYSASHDFIYNTLNIIKILFIAFKSNRKVRSLCIYLLFIKLNLHQTPIKALRQGQTLIYFGVRPNLVLKFHCFLKKINLTPTFQLVWIKCSYQASGSLFSTTTR